MNIKKYSIYAILFGSFGTIYGTQVIIDSSKTTREFIEELKKNSNIQVLKFKSEMYDFISVKLDFDNADIPWDALKNITELDLSWTNINKKGLMSFIGKCPHLEKLNLLWCAEITKEDFYEIEWTNLKNLKELNLSNTNIDKKGLMSFIGKCLHLERLNLSWCKNIDKENINWTIPKNLKALNLSNTNIDNVGLKNLIDQCPELEILDLSWCTEITKEGFNEIEWTNLKNLKELNFSGTNIGDAGLNNLIDTCSNLRILKLSYCKNIKTVKLNKYAAAIELLNLAGTNIENADLNNFIRKCSHLKILQLNNCRNITMNNVEKINWNGLEYLEELDISGAGIDLKTKEPNLENIDFLENINLKCPKLKNLFFLEGMLHSTAPDKLKTYLEAKRRKYFENKKNSRFYLKFSLGIGVATLALVGAVLIYKKVSVLQNISNMIWRKVSPLVKKTYAFNKQQTKFI